MSLKTRRTGASDEALVDDRLWFRLTLQQLLGVSSLHKVAVSIVQETQTQRPDKTSYCGRCVSHIFLFYVSVFVFLKRTYLKQMVSGSGSLS